MKSTVRFTGMLLLVLLPVRVFAQFAEDALRFSRISTGVGARSMALGGVSVGRTADYSSLFANPAALTSIRDYEISLGFSRNAVSNEATYLGVRTEEDHSSTMFENVGLVYPIPTARGSM